MDFFQPAPNPNKERYELMLKRRQALLELAKLKDTILTHPEWHESLKQNASIEKALEKKLFSFGKNLCQNFCQSNSEALHTDIRNIYAQLICLSKVWLALEEKQPIFELLITL